MALWLLLSGSFVLSLVTDKPRYAPEEPITITLTVSNPTREPVTLQFTTGQRYDFMIEDEAGKLVWAWAEDRMFVQILGEATIAPGVALAYRETFTGRLAPGAYRVTGTLTALAERRSASAVVTVTR